MLKRFRTLSWKPCIYEMKQNSTNNIDNNLFFFSIRNWTESLLLNPPVEHALIFGSEEINVSLFFLFSEIKETHNQYLAEASLGWPPRLGYRNVQFQLCSLAHEIKSHPIFHSTRAHVGTLSGVESVSGFETAKLSCFQQRYSTHKFRMRSTQKTLKLVLIAYTIRTALPFELNRRYYFVLVLNKCKLELCLPQLTLFRVITFFYHVHL